jgi:hypothetical protein
VRARWCCVQFKQLLLCCVLHSHSMLASSSTCCLVLSISNCCSFVHLKYRLIALQHPSSVGCFSCAVCCCTACVLFISDLTAAALH